MPRTKVAGFDLQAYLEQRRTLDAQKKEAIAALIKQKAEIESALAELQGEEPRRGRPAKAAKKASKKGAKKATGRRGRPPGAKNKPKEVPAE
jgi:hypothetical protein